MIDVTGKTNSIKNSAAIMSMTDAFVVNLCAAMTPMPSVPKSLKGYENFRLYQISRIEDGRHRYRLRLGFFNSEADAEIALASLRSMYPAAFTSRASAEDMRYSGDPLLTGRFEARPTGTTTPATKPAAVVAVSNTTPKAPPAQLNQTSAKLESRPGAAPVLSGSAKAAVMPEVRPQSPAQPLRSAELKNANEVRSPVEPLAAKERSAPSTMSAQQPFHVGRGIDLPETNLELAPTIIPTKKADAAAPQWVHLQTPSNKPATQPPSQVQSAAKPKTAAPSLPVGKPGAAKAPPAAPQRGPVGVSAATTSAPAIVKKVAPTQLAARAAAPVVAKVAAAVAKPAHVQPAALSTVIKPAAKPNDDYVPVLDTTMTIRTLTPTEMEDVSQAKWFAVQLAVSEQVFNLDAMPRLDIFAAYRVYSVAVKEEGKLKHSLRLGFFKEDVSADAVAGYLKTFFPAPLITRVSVAEYDRFIEPKEPEPVAKVVAIEQKREAVIAPSKPTFGINPAPTPERPKAQKSSKPKWETAQPGYRPGPSGKYSIDTVKKNQGSPSASDAGGRQSARPQSFLSKLIGRELD